SRRITTSQVKKALESLRGGKRFFSLWGEKSLQRTAFAGAAGGVLLRGALLSWGGVNRTFASLKSGVAPPEISLGQQADYPTFYSVHLASFRKQRLAEQSIEKNCREGLEAFGMVFHYEGIGTWYRVVVGQYEKREEAQRLADHLKANGSYPYSVVIPLPQDQPKIRPEKKRPRL
ncbi:MAG: SPOR domain-containing protein, partial [Thermodesulfobacteriota bacterium]